MSDFLGGFVTYLSRRTDCPADFHIHAAMAALAAALGNRVWCDGWARAIYPSLWIVILAPSGFGKYHNLVANPEVPVEVGDKRFPARATIVEGSERERLFDAQAALMPNFAGYQSKTTRQIPVIVLQPIESA